MISNTVTLAYVAGVNGSLAGVPYPVWLLGLVFAVTGAWIVLAAPRALLRARSVIYGVTDRRVFICTRRRVQSWAGRDLNILKCRRLVDGSGDVLFREDVSSSYSGRQQMAWYGFYGVPRLAEVEAMLATLRDAAA